jgi:hypothetical protein
MDGLFSFTTFDADISAKVMTSESAAWRFGASINGFHAEGILPTVMEPPLTAVVQRVWYPSATDETLFYYGLGPQIAYSYSHTSYGARQTTYRTWYFGASALAGVEWFATKSISASLEYNLDAWYSRTHDYQTSNPPASSDYSLRGTGWSLSDQNLIFGVNVYIGKLW